MLMILQCETIRCCLCAVGALCTSPGAVTEMCRMVKDHQSQKEKMLDQEIRPMPTSLEERLTLVTSMQP